MPFVVKCAACGKRYQVGDALAGKEIKCQACQASIPVSAPPAADAAARAGGEPELDLGFAGAGGADDLLGLLGEQPPHGVRPSPVAPVSGGPSMPRFAAPVAQPTPGMAPMLLDPLPTLPSASMSNLPTLPAHGLPSHGLPSIPSHALALRRPEPTSTWQRAALLWGGVALGGMLLIGGLVLSSFKGSPEDAGQSIAQGAQATGRDTGPARRPSPETGAVVVPKSQPAAPSRTPYVPPRTASPAVKSPLAVPDGAAPPVQSPAGSPAQVEIPRRPAAPASDTAVDSPDDTPPAIASAPATPAAPASPADPAAAADPEAAVDTAEDVAKYVAEILEGGEANRRFRASTKAAGWRAAPEADLQLPGFDPDWELRLPADRWSEAVYGPAPSQVVAVKSGSGREGTLDVYQLGSGELVGRVNLESWGRLEGVGLSADGKLLLLPASSGRNGFAIYDVPEEKLVVNVPGGDVFARGRFSAFAGSKRVLTDCLERDRLTILELPTGKLIASLPAASVFSDHYAAISPGGKYVAVFTDGRITLYDTDAGRRMGEIIGLPARERCQGIAFSQDGKELAAMLKNDRLYVWSMAGGKQLFEHDLSAEQRRMTGFADGALLQWLPGRTGWLVKSTLLLERNTGKVAWALPNRIGHKKSVRVMSNFQLVGVNDQDSLENIRLPMRMIAAAAKSLQAGGEASDAGMPQLLAVSLKGVKTLPLGIPAKWSAVPDPLPVDQAELRSAVLQLHGELNQTKTVAFSSPQAAQVVVGGAAEPSDQVEAEMLPGWYDHYDLESGEVVSRQELPHSCRLLSVSSDGKRIVTLAGPAQDRVDVWELDGHRHVCGFRPYGHQVVDARRFSSNRRTTRSVRWAGLADPQHLVTLSDSRQLIVWNLETGKALYVMENVGGTRTISSARDRNQSGDPVFTPGGKYLVVVTPIAVHLIEPLTGKVAGAIPLPTSDQIDAFSANFHPQGSRLCLVQGDMLLVYDTAEGRLLGDVCLPVAVDRVQWVSPDHVMVGEQLYDLNRQAIVWQYRNASTGSAYLKSPGDLRLWYITSNGNAHYLASAMVPDAVVANQVEAAIPPGAAPLLTRGSKVRLEFSYSGDGADEVQERLRQQLVASGMEIVDDAPYVVRASTETTGTEAKVYRVIGVGAGINETVTVNYTRMRCQLAVLDRNGKLLWQRVSNVGSYPQHFISGEISQYENQHLRMAHSYFMGLRLPKEVYRQPRSADGTQLGLGVSELSINGPVVQQRFELQK